MDTAKARHLFFLRMAQRLLFVELAHCTLHVRIVQPECVSLAAEFYAGVP
jgi:hypothetical protein